MTHHSLKFYSEKSMRMCICCRLREQQKKMLRLSLKDGKIIVFEGFGRSFYVCEECLNHSGTIKKISKIKKLSVESEVNLKEMIDQWNK
ncbi:hypothetical protein BBW65_04605 [Helicobacter enhydrae]|uniref:YlxR domain-containing protein n=1 Tax=Helicobacter enhydrae TaxID=222136 RepID=A0A1B1U5P7_9HELI|nr:DUF448 domain-containing protein [Helicobacter enhydrae]ANV98124.1 hypothetical protein BBW65_04605 [Helicobacter enhydrae]